jgi:hypothetical protein
MAQSIPPTAKLLVALSFLIAVFNIALAFAPYGYGFATVFTAAVGVMLGGSAAKSGLEKEGLWASRANGVGVIVYVIYMLTWMPASTSDHNFTATVTETGVLEDQMVFHKKVRAAGQVLGIRMAVDPCENDWVVRVTGKPISQLGRYAPSKQTRECLNKIEVGQKLNLQIQADIRSLTGEVKGFRVLGVGDCPFDQVDLGAVVKADACKGWF